MKQAYGFGTRAAAITLVAGAVLASVPGHAQIAVGSADGPGATSRHVYQTDYAAWVVADLKDPFNPAPLEIRSTGASGPWTQEFTFATAFPAPEPGSRFAVHEILSFGEGEFSVGNWKLEVTTPGWQWAEGTLFDVTTAEPLAGLSAERTASLLGFDFAPVATGTEVFLAATLEYVGPGGVGPEAILLKAYTAIPEPGSGLLLKLGAAAIFLAGVGHRPVRGSAAARRTESLPGLAGDRSAADSE